MRTIIVHEDDFEILHSEQRVFKVVWNEITSISVFKAPGDEYDLRLSLTTAKSPRAYEIQEIDEGFEIWLAMLEKKLPSFDRDWYELVAVPEFKTGPTIVYEKNIP